MSPKWNQRSRGRSVLYDAVGGPMNSFVDTLVTIRLFLNIWPHMFCASHRGASEPTNQKKTLPRGSLKNQRNQPTKVRRQDPWLGVEITADSFGTWVALPEGIVATKKNWWHTPIWWHFWWQLRCACKCYDSIFDIQCQYISNGDHVTNFTAAVTKS